MAPKRSDKELRAGGSPSPPVSACEKIRFQFADGRAGCRGETGKATVAAAAGWRTPTQASMFPRLCGSGSAPQLPPGPRRCGGPEAGREEGSDGELSWEPNGPARTSRQSRGTQRADFWEM